MLEGVWASKGNFISLFFLVQKVIIFEQFTIQNNNKIAELDKWDQKAIDKRVLELYDLFIQVW